MDSYLYRLFAGLLNPSADINPDSADYKAALHRLIEIQHQLQESLPPEQFTLLDDMLAQKNVTLSYEKFEAFKAGVTMTAGILMELFE